MYLTSDRKGNVTKEDSIQDKFFVWMYGHALGRMVLKPLVSPFVSQIGGKLMECRLSKLAVPFVIRSHGIRMVDFEQKKYTSYNDFFTRKLLPGMRRIEEEPDSLVSPCDSRLSVYPVSEECSFSIKHTRYTLKGLLRSRKLAEAYAGGFVWVFRLRVEDYHHYIYVDSGRVSGNYRIPGVFHTVNPAANDQFPIYKENTREFSLLKSDHFGTVLQMEVGALLVGKIENHPGGRMVQRGWEKGNFAFGGSTVVLVTQAGMVCPDADILENSKKGIETKVRLGERVGVRNRRYTAGRRNL